MTSATMTDPNFLLLYVDNPENSASFYTGLLGRKPVEASANFAMFALGAGVMLGLWSKHTAEPKPDFCGGGGELGFPAADKATVDAIHRDWSGRGLTIAQAPVQMDFGYTFVALDPDQHRLRVFTPSAA